MEVMCSLCNLVPCGRGPLQVTDSSAAVSIQQPAPINLQCTHLSFRDAKPKVASVHWFFSIAATPTSGYTCTWELARQGQ